MNKYQKLHYSYDDRAAMREGRRRPSLSSHYNLAFTWGFAGGCEWRVSTYA